MYKPYESINTRYVSITHQLPLPTSIANWHSHPRRIIQDFSRFQALFLDQSWIHCGGDQQLTTKLTIISALRRDKRVQCQTIPLHSPAASTSAPTTICSSHSLDAASTSANQWWPSTAPNRVETKLPDFFDPSRGPALDGRLHRPRLPPLTTREGRYWPCSCSVCNHLWMDVSAKQPDREGKRQPDGHTHMHTPNSKHGQGDTNGQQKAALSPRGGWASKKEPYSRNP